MPTRRAHHQINGQPWPDGTVVTLYPVAARPAGYDGAPMGESLATAVVDDGAVHFNELTERVRYLAYAAGKSIDFLVPLHSPTDSNRSRVIELEEDVIAVEEDIQISTEPDTDNGLPILTITSAYGINAAGEPYYDPEGAEVGELAVLTVDPATGFPTLTLVIGDLP